MLQLGLVGLVGIWVLLVVALYLLQTRLIFPGGVTQGTAAAEFALPPAARLLDLRTRRGDRVRAVFAPALNGFGERLPSTRDQPTLVYFYGNGTCLSRINEGELEWFRRLGVNVLVHEYVGYGLSSGIPSEQGCYDTADAAYQWLQAQDDLDPSRVVVLGQSLGGAVALDLASRHPVAGAITLCTFTSMGQMASRQHPYVPVRWLLRHRFESLAKIRGVACPILLVHGSEDQLVPSDMAHELAAGAVPGRATVVLVPGAHHNDLLAVGSDPIRREILTFLARLTPARTIP